MVIWVRQELFVDVLCEESVRVAQASKRKVRTKTILMFEHRLDGLEIL